MESPQKQLGSKHSRCHNGKPASDRPQYQKMSDNHTNNKRRGGVLGLLRLLNCQNNKAKVSREIPLPKLKHSPSPTTSTLGYSSDTDHDSPVQKVRVTSVDAFLQRAEQAHAHLQLSTEPDNTSFAEAGSMISALSMDPALMAISRKYGGADETYPIHPSTVQSTKKSPRKPRTDIPLAPMQQPYHKRYRVTQQPSGRYAQPDTSLISCGSSAMYSGGWESYLQDNCQSIVEEARPEEDELSEIAPFDLVSL